MFNHHVFEHLLSCIFVSSSLPFSGLLRLSVCMLSWETLYTVSGGAAAPYVTGLAEALVRRGHEVHVFTRASHGLKINIETVNGVVYHEAVAQLYECKIQVHGLDL